MSRATRRRMERQQEKGSILEPAKGTGEIQLYNPVTSHFKSFIFANSTKCDRVVEQGTRAGQTVVICGAGPSLREHIDEYHKLGNEVWGINSAAPWLYEQGYRITHGFSIDQTPVMLREWIAAYPLDYLLASTVHPHLVEYLHMKRRELTFFHNFVAIDEPPVQWQDSAGTMRTSSFEDWMYQLLYPATVRAGAGLNGATRAVDVARYMGFERIILLGADCSITATGPMPPELEQGSQAQIDWLAANTRFHVGGGHAVENGQSPLTLQGEIDGRFWLTKVDLMISAVQIAKWLRGSVPELEVIGDTLPNALKDKDDEFFEQLPALKSSTGERIKTY